MPQLPHPKECLWTATAGSTSFPALDGDREAEVVVLGGGVIGLTAALLLRAEGRGVTLLERDGVGLGVSALSTVKLSAGHGLLYSKIHRRFGAEVTAEYGRANLLGLRMMRDLVGQHGIDCDWEAADHYVWASDDRELDQVRAEVDAERVGGLDAELLDAAPELPFPVAGALRLRDQVRCHPRRYLLGLADAARAAGVKIYENTRAKRVEPGEPAIVETEHGRVRAPAVVVATHFPILDRGFLYAKMIQWREYAVAGPVDPERAPRHMYINAASPTRSIRIAPSSAGPLLIVVGEGHKVGEREDTEMPYEALEDWGREHFGVDRWEYGWSNQDNLSMDNLPFVGALAKGVWVATGMNTWGMTMGTASARLLADLIVGRPDPLAPILDPGRGAIARAAGTFVKENVKVARHFFTDRLRAPATELRAIAPGTAAVVKVNGEQVAAYREEDGTLHAVSAVCTHLRCIVAWNAAERSWDCPCHGSRFAPDGRVLNAPATEPLRPFEPGS